MARGSKVKCLAGLAAWLLLLLLLLLAAAAAAAAAAQPPGTYRPSQIPAPRHTHRPFLINK